MQFPGNVKPPVGIVFDSDMGNRIDTALAMSLLYGLDGKNEARVVSVSVSKPGTGRKFGPLATGELVGSE